jgi:hypothetical protein
MEGESKYHVANILSNLSNGGHASVQVNTVRFFAFIDHSFVCKNYYLAYFVFLFK